MGLSGFGQWEDGEEPYSTLSGRRLDIEEMGSAKSNDRITSGGGFFGFGVGKGGAMAGLLGDWSADVPAETLADPDSKFADVFGLRLHYKEVWPLGQGTTGNGSGGTGGGVASRGSPGGSSSSSGNSDADGGSGSGSTPALGGTSDLSGTGIVLVHGFGGGVFAWRHIMEDLALQCQCRVIAFDRPGFGERGLTVHLDQDSHLDPLDCKKLISLILPAGPLPGLTSRPIISREQRHSSANPYSMGAQAEMTMQLCAQLGLKRVLLLAHADACLLALRAASLSAEHQAYLAHEAAAVTALVTPPPPVASSLGGDSADGGGCGGDDDGESLNTDDLAALAAEVEDDGCCGNDAQSHLTLTVHPAETSYPISGVPAGNLLRRRNPSSAVFPPPADILSSNSSLTEALHSPPPPTGGKDDPHTEGHRVSSDSLLGTQHGPSSASETFFPDASVAATGQDSMPAGEVGTAAVSRTGRQPGSGTSSISSYLASVAVASGVSGHRSGFEGPDAYAAASSALGLLPSESLEGDALASPLDVRTAGVAGQIRADGGGGATGLCSSSSAGPPVWGGGGSFETMPGAASSSSLGNQHSAARGGGASRHRRAMSVPFPG